MTEKKTLYTKHAPEPIGPYAQAIIVNGLVYTSGQIPIDLDGKVVGNTISEQCKQVCKNIDVILKEANSSLQQVIKTTCFLTDMTHFSAFNEVYAQYFSQNSPARSCIAVKTLPKNVLVEIEVIAIANSD